MAVVWDVATATERRRLTMPEMGSLAVVASNGRLAVGLSDGSVRLYDLNTGKEQNLSARHRTDDSDWVYAGVVAVAFTPDGNTLITAGGDDRFVRCWNLTHGKKQWEIDSIKGSVEVFAVSPDGKTLAVGGDDGVIRLLDTTTGAEICPQPGHQGGVMALTVSADSRTAVTTSFDHTIRIWDLPVARELRQIAAGGVATSCTMAPDARTILTSVRAGDSPRDGLARFWNVTGGHEIRLPELTRTTAECLRLSADGRILVTLRGDKVGVRKWPSCVLQREITLPPPRSLSVLGNILAISSDGKLVVASAYYVKLDRGMIVDAEGGSLDLWDVSTGKHIRQLSPSGSHAALAVFTAAGELIIASRSALAGAKDKDLFPYGAVYVVNSRTGRALRAFPLHRFGGGEPYPVTALTVARDGRTAYVGGRDGTIHAYEVATGDIRFRLAGHRDRVNDLAMVARDRRLVSASQDATALVWDVSLPAAPPPKDLESTWKDLSGADAAKAFKAMAAMAAAPDRSIRFLAANLPPAGAEPSPATLDRLIADLDNAKFAVREKAEAELGMLAELAMDRVRVRLSTAKTPESRLRLNRLVEKLDSGQPWPARIREIRALELLEYLATAEARDVLTALAKGNPMAWLTQEATAILQRADRN
jgi:WD40 repeat protein